MGSPGVKGKKQTFRILSNSSFEHKMSQNTNVLTYLFYSVSNTKIFSIIFFLPLQHNLKLNHQEIKRIVPFLSFTQIIRPGKTLNSHLIQMPHFQVRKLRPPEVKLGLSHVAEQWLLTRIEAHSSLAQLSSLFNNARNDMLYSYITWSHFKIGPQIASVQRDNLEIGSHLKDMDRCPPALEGQPYIQSVKLRNQKIHSNTVFLALAFRFI